jgi:hypothetical protein
VQFHLARSSANKTDDLELQRKRVVVGLGDEEEERLGVKTDNLTLRDHIYSANFKNAEGSQGLQAVLLDSRKGKLLPGRPRARCFERGGPKTRPDTPLFPLARVSTCSKSQRLYQARQSAVRGAAAAGVVSIWGEFRGVSACACAPALADFSTYKNAPMQSS